MEDQEGYDFDKHETESLEQVATLNVKLENDSHGINEIKANHLTPTEDDRVTRSGRTNKPKSLDDFLPVLVEVWAKMSPEIRCAYKIFRELLNDKVKCTIEPFLDEVDANVFQDYYNVVKDPMDFFKISEKFHNMEYTSITEVVADIRQIIENCFRYNGVESFISRQAKKLEVILEQKLNLLSRELRSKTSIAATNKVKNKEYLNNLLFTSGGGRCLSQKHRNGETSLIAMQMHLQEELDEKERKRLKDKEKKEMSVALEEECEKWTKEVLNDDLMADVKTSWEIPAVGIFLCILKDFLNLQDFNFSEFEIGVLFPRKSSLLARIFTSLLVTSFQRKKLSSQNPMEYRIWSEKVKSRIISWYKIASTHGQEYSASLFGFDADLFGVLGFLNPFHNAEFHELPLQSRMWVLKAFCEVALEQDSTMRDHFGELEFIDRQDLCLGTDSDGFSYHYISRFGTTDLRIYKQKTLSNPGIPTARNQPIMMEKEDEKAIDHDVKSICKENDKMESNQNHDHATEKGDDTEKLSVRTSKRIRTKRSLSPPPAQVKIAKMEKKVEKRAIKDFMLVVNDIQSLKELVDKFDGSRKEKGVKRQQEKELQQSLDALYVELKKREANFVKSNQKARIKIMVECKEWEVKESAKSEDEKKQTGWDSENDEDDFDMEQKMEENPAKNVLDGETETVDIAVENLTTMTEVFGHDFISEEVPQDDSLTKEGRKLRSKRFDVKMLFSDSSQPPSKRMRIERKKEEINRRHVNSARNTHIYAQNGQNEAEKASDRHKSSRRINQNLKRKHGIDDFISEKEIRLLREKRLEKIKKDLKEGKVLSIEEQRNLMHLGLARQELEELLNLRDRNLDIRKVENESNHDDAEMKNATVVKTDNSKAFLSYDGLKALADVASLCQQQSSPDGSSSKCKQEPNDNQLQGKVNDKLSNGKYENQSSKLANGGNTKLILLGNHHDKSKATSGSVVCVIEDKAKQDLDRKEHTSTVDKSKSQTSSRRPSQMKSNAMKGRSPVLSIRNGEGKEKIIITTNAKTVNSAETDGIASKDRPLILQRTRPNILRKSTGVMASNPVSTTPKDDHLNLTSSTAPCITDSNAKGGKISIAKSIAANANVSKTIPPNQCSSAGMADVKLVTESQLVTSTKNQVVKRVKRSITSAGKPSISICPKKPSVQKQQVKSVAKSSFRSIQSKPAAGPLVIVTQSSQVIGHNGVPLILASNTQPLLQGKSPDVNQSVLLLTAKQSLIKQSAFQSKGQQQQQQQCVLVKQQGNARLLTYDQQQQQQQQASKSETGTIIATNCPVTTLKSKLHAAALKRKLSSKNKNDVIPNNYQTITTKVVSSVKIDSRLSGAVIAPQFVTVPQTIVQNTGISAVKATIIDPTNQVKTIGLVNTAKPSKIMNPLKIAPKTVQILNSNIVAGSQLNAVACRIQNAGGNDLKLNPVTVFNPKPVVSLVSNPKVIISRNSTHAVTTVVSNAQAPGGSNLQSLSTGLKNYQIVNKLNKPVSTTSTDKAVFFTNWSRAYVPRAKSRVLTPKQKPIVSVPGKKSSMYQPIKPAITRPQGTSGQMVQVPTKVLVAPVGFSTYKRTISMPAQIVQLPAQIPSKQEVSGAAESNRDVATAAQLVIVPQTRAPKQIRPAIDSTTAVKALKSLEQVMKPSSTASSLTAPEMPKAKANVKTAAENSLPAMPEINSTTSSSESKETLSKSCSSIAPNSDAISSQSQMSTGLLVLMPNQDVADTSTSVKDKSSVTFSTLSPIPCAEIKAPVSNLEPLTLKGEDTSPPRS